jgi:hypothetical protein
MTRKGLSKTQLSVYARMSPSTIHEVTHQAPGKEDESRRSGKTSKGKRRIYRLICRTRVLLASDIATTAADGEESNYTLHHAEDIDR